jgi:hypothetical protein
LFSLSINGTTHDFSSDFKFVAEARNKFSNRRLLDQSFIVSPKTEDSSEDLGSVIVARTAHFSAFESRVIEAKERIIGVVQINVVDVERKIFRENAVMKTEKVLKSEPL